MNDWGIPMDEDINPLGAAPTPDGEPTPERGVADKEFTDGTGSVTMGVDAAGVLVSLLVHNSWRDRGRGHRLDLLVQTASLQWRVQQPPTEFEMPAFRATWHEVEPRWLLERDYFDDRELDALDRSLSELAEPVDPDEDGYRDKIDFTPAVGTSGNRKVTVTLGMGKLLDSCTIDHEWSMGARAEKIGTTFMEAHDRALAEYREPILVPGRARVRAQQAADITQRSFDLMAGRDRKDAQ